MDYNHLFFLYSGDYQNNICSRNDLTCTPCPERLPSCEGNQDGANAFPGKLWSHDYITCLRNRTIRVTSCPQGQFFNPDTRQCTNQISTSMLSYIDVAISWVNLQFF